MNRDSGLFYKGRFCNFYYYYNEDGEVHVFYRRMSGREEEKAEAIWWEEELLSIEQFIYKCKAWEDVFEGNLAKW